MKKRVLRACAALMLLACAVFPFAGRACAAETHWYGKWSPAKNGYHTAVCQLEGCNSRAERACQFCDILISGEIFSVCPVCGGVPGGEGFSRLAGADTARQFKARNRGELIARMGALADGTHLITFAWEYDGKLTSPEDTLRVSINAADAGESALLAIAPDGAQTHLQTVEENGRIYFDIQIPNGESAPPVAAILVFSY